MCLRKLRTETPITSWEEDRQSLSLAEARNRELEEENQRLRQQLADAD
jgi:hypothetical protein